MDEFTSFSQLIGEKLEEHLNNRFGEVIAPCGQIRETLCNYYQALVKNRLAERLVQALIAELDVEEQRLDDLIESLQASIRQAIAHAASGTSAERRALAGGKAALKEVEQHQQQLRKLKGLIRL